MPHRPTPQPIRLVHGPHGHTEPALTRTRLSLSRSCTELTAEGWGKGRDEDGAWTDDHIIPKTAYGATEEDMLRCHNKANHQPLGVSQL